MKKYAAKVLSLVLCLSLVSACLTPAYAAAAGERVNLAQYTDYANSLIPELSRLPDTNLPEAGLSLSQPLEILNNNDSTKRVFFLFHEDACVGELAVTRLGGEFAASFLAAELPQVSAAYAQEVPVCLVSEERALLLCTDAGTEVIVGKLDQEANVSRANVGQAVAVQARKEPLALSPAAMPAGVQASELPEESCRALAVQHVNNMKVNGVGICWAAVAASIIMYLTPEKNLSAKTVYNMVWMDVYGAKEETRPSGMPSDALAGLSHYGVTYYKAIDATMHYSVAVKHIDAGYPIYASLAGNSSETHAVTVCGYKNMTGGGKLYQLVDPNVEPPVWVTVSSNLYGLTYPTPYDNITWTSWFRTVYSTRVR